MISLVKTQNIINNAHDRLSTVDFMDFDEYQSQAKTTAIYPKSAKIIYPTLGLASEAGEVAGKVKRQIRDNKFDKQELANEIGDCLWYCAAIASDADLSLGEIAKNNLEKLKSRHERGVITGSGDNR
jgi:NTP pyrophosphatase (non-canonical NTP hydrolase)